MRYRLYRLGTNSVTLRKVIGVGFAKSNKLSLQGSTMHWLCTIVVLTDPHPQTFNSVELCLSWAVGRGSGASVLGLRPRRLFQSLIGVSTQLARFHGISTSKSITVYVQFRNPNRAVVVELPTTVPFLDPLGPSSLGVESCWDQDTKRSFIYFSRGSFNGVNHEGHFGVDTTCRKARCAWRRLTTS